MNSGISAIIVGLLGLGNYVYSNSSVCCIGLEVIILVVDSICVGCVKCMFVGVIEGSLLFIWVGFDFMCFLCCKYNDKFE